MVNLVYHLLFAITIMATKATYQPLLSEWDQYTESANSYNGFTRVVQNAHCREMLIRATGTSISEENEEEITLTIGANHFYYLFHTEHPVHSALDGLKHWLTAHGYQIKVLCHKAKKEAYEAVGRTSTQEEWMQRAATLLERGEEPEANTPLKQRLLEDVRKDLASRSTRYATVLLVRAPPRVGLPSRKYINASSWNLSEDLILVSDEGVELRISSASVKLREAEYPNPPENPSWFGLYFSSDIFKKPLRNDPEDPENGILNFREYRFAVLRGFKSFLIDPEGFRDEFIKLPAIQYIYELLKLSKFLMFDSFTYFLLSIGEQLEQNNVRGFAPETVESRMKLADESLDERKPLYPGFVADFAGDHLELASAINAKLWNNRSYSDYVVALLNLPDGSYIRDHAPDMSSFKSPNIFTIKATSKFTYFFGDKREDILYVRPHQEGSLILAIGKREVNVKELTTLHGHDHRFKICPSNNKNLPGTEVDPEAHMYQVYLEMLRLRRLQRRISSRDYTIEEVYAEFPPTGEDYEDIAEEEDDGE